jgi:glucose-1-phosphate thymidylyltransferase
MLGGIQQILVISTPRDLPALRTLLGDGGQWGIELSYAEQPRPEGIAQALLIAEPFLAGGSAALMLGDNVLFGHGLESLLAKAIECNSGATIFAHRVQDPERYGVVGFDAQGRPNSIEEKRRCLNRLGPLPVSTFTTKMPLMLQNGSPFRPVANLKSQTSMRIIWRGVGSQ